MIQANKVCERRKYAFLDNIYLRVMSGFQGEGKCIQKIRVSQKRDLEWSGRDGDCNKNTDEVQDSNCKMIQQGNKMISTK